MELSFAYRLLILLLVVVVNVTMTTLAMVERVERHETEQQSRHAIAMVLLLRYHIFTYFYTPIAQLLLPPQNHQKDTMQEGPAPHRHHCSSLANVIIRSITFFHYYVKHREIKGAVIEGSPVN